MRLGVDFSPEALTQLRRLFRYIAEVATPMVAAQSTDSIVSYCESLRTFPERGVRRDDIRPNLRMTYYRKRVAIAFVVREEGIGIVGIFYGGQVYQARLGCPIEP